METKVFKRRSLKQNNDLVGAYTRRIVDKEHFSDLEEIRQRIAKRAYELFLQRGCEHGHDIEDWLAAEKEIAS